MSSLKWLPLIIPIYCLFWNLGHVAFWDDEAQTVILAKNFLSTGQLTGWDGERLYGYRNGSLLREDFAVIQPPLDILVTAASFRFLGESEITARLPFAIAGLLSLFVFASILTTLGLSKRVRFWVILSLAFSTQFLLSARQCRYYALCLLFGLIFYRLWLSLLSAPSWTKSLLLSLVAFLFYLSNYMIAVAFISITGVTSLIYRREHLYFAKKYWVASALLTTALILPHAFAFKIWSRSDISHDDSWILRHLHHLWKYPRDLLFYFPIPLAVWLGYLSRPAGRYPRVWEMFLLFYGNAIFISLLTPQPSFAIYSDFRFLILSLPWGAALLGSLVERLGRGRFKVGIAVFLIATGTSLFTVGYTRQPFKWTFPSLLSSIHQYYPTGIARAAQYLKQHRVENETVYASSAHFSYPVAFYSGASVCCMLDKDTQLRNARMLKAPLFRETSEPDWLLLFEDAPHTRQDLEYFGHRALYQQATVIDVYYDQTQRPEPFEHEFFPRKEFSPTQRVFVFHRLPR